MTEYEQNVMKDKKADLTNSISDLLNKKNADKCLDASEEIALYLKENFIVRDQNKVLWHVHKILEDWYVEEIAIAKNKLEKQEENLKIFHS